MIGAYKKCKHDKAKELAQLKIMHNNRQQCDLLLLQAGFTLSSLKDTETELMNLQLIDLEGDEASFRAILSTSYADFVKIIFEIDDLLADTTVYDIERRKQILTRLPIKEDWKAKLVKSNFLSYDALLNLLCRQASGRLEDRIPAHLEDRIPAHLEDRAPAHLEDRAPAHLEDRAPAQLDLQGYYQQLIETYSKAPWDNIEVAFQKVVPVFTSVGMMEPRQSNNSKGPENSVADWKLVKPRRKMLRSVGGNTEWDTGDVFQINNFQELRDAVSSMKVQYGEALEFHGTTNKAANLIRRDRLRATGHLNEFSQDGAAYTTSDYNAAVHRAFFKSEESSISIIVFRPYSEATAKVKLARYTFHNNDPVTKKICREFIHINFSNIEDYDYDASFPKELLDADVVCGKICYNPRVGNPEKITFYESNQLAYVTPEALDDLDARKINVILRCFTEVPNLTLEHVQPYMS